MTKFTKYPRILNPLKIINLDTLLQTKKGGKVSKSDIDLHIRLLYHDLFDPLLALRVCNNLLLSIYFGVYISFLF